MPTSTVRQRAKKTEWPHIVLDARGTPIIDNIGFKVYLLAVDHVRHGLQIGDLLDAYPGIAPAEIFSALAYYYDHKAAMDADIDRGEREVDELRRTHPNKLTKEQLLSRLQDHSKSTLADVPGQAQ